MFQKVSPWPPTCASQSTTHCQQTATTTSTPYRPKTSAWAIQPFRWCWRWLLAVCCLWSHSHSYGSSLAAIQKMQLKLPQDNPKNLQLQTDAEGRRTLSSRDFPGIIRRWWHPQKNARSTGTETCDLRFLKQINYIVSTCFSVFISTFHIPRLCALSLIFTFLLFWWLISMVSIAFYAFIIYIPVIFIVIRLVLFDLLTIYDNLPPVFFLLKSSDLPVPMCISVGFT